MLPLGPDSLGKVDLQSPVCLQEVSSNSSSCYSKPGAGERVRGRKNL